MIGCGPGEGDKETVLDYKKSNSEYRQFKAKYTSINIEMPLQNKHP